MGLSTEEKTMFKQSKLMEEINRRLSITKNSFSISIPNFSTSIGRTIVNEEEIEDLIDLITKKLEYPATMSVNYIDNLIIITKI